MLNKAAARWCQRTLREYLHSLPADALPGRGPLVYACGVHLFKAAWASAEAATAFGRYMAVAEMTGDMRVALLNGENTVVLAFKTVECWWCHDPIRPRTQITLLHGVGAFQMTVGPETRPTGGAILQPAVRGGRADGGGGGRDRVRRGCGYGGCRSALCQHTSGRACLQLRRPRLPRNIFQRSDVPMLK